MSTLSNINNLREHIPNSVILVCVSKFHPVEKILEVYELGERHFGESRVQEFIQKVPLLPKDIHWHFIGHLQTNKIKQIIPFVDLIHGVDSIRVLQEINKQAERIDKKVACLLQIHIAQEDTKFGFSPEEVVELLSSELFLSLKHIQISGLMGMATNTNDKAQIRKEFQNIHFLFEKLKKEFFKDDSNFCELSIGMSDDYRIAIEENSTMIRIGTAIFGEREY